MMRTGGNVAIISRLGRVVTGQSRAFGKKAKKGQQQQHEEEAVPMKAVSRPAAPPPVPKYAVDGSKLDSGSATGGGSCSPKETGVVMAEAVSEATLKQVLSEAADGKTDDDLFRALTTANADGPVSLRVSAVTPSTAIAILEACAIKRVRSFPDLARISAILLRPGNPRMTAEEATSLLRLYTFMGSINEPLALACANSVVPLLPQMSWHDIAAVARDMARHRARPRTFFDIILTRAATEIGAIDSKDIFSLWHTMCYLRIPCPEEDRGRLADEVVKRAREGTADLEDIIDAAYACSMMSLQALKEGGYQHRTLRPLVEQIIACLEAGGIGDSWFVEHRAAHRRLLLVRAHLRYCLREDLYVPLSENAKMALRRVHRIDVEADRAVEKYPEDAHPLRLPKSITQLSLILRKLKVAHFVRARRGPFTFDILERDRRLIWECNNFDRYYGSSFDKLATRRLEERILKAMGYRIVQVPFWHWRRVTLKSRRIDMIRMSRFIALRDFRERHMAQGDADQYSDPTKVGGPRFDPRRMYFLC
ncbi:hypothetical protein FOZ62_010805 [Perkinsus olseni]|uniref:RAP domain-containing protein n=1 Tax=Perkinsus olseni TaxID=32597 RepID=A0A7J6TYM0_PEROL|nr:hypothetical protein FOZ62_010805 [Perkinsus olseni]